MNSLQNPYTFTNLKDLFQVHSFLFDLDWNFLFSYQSGKTGFNIDRVYHSLTVYELTVDYFASITDLNSHITIISNSF